MADLTVPINGTTTVNEMYNMNLLLKKIVEFVDSDESFSTISNGATIEVYLNNNVELLKLLCNKIGISIPTLL